MASPVQAWQWGPSLSPQALDPHDGQKQFKPSVRAGHLFCFVPHGAQHGARHTAGAQHSGTQQALSSSTQQALSTAAHSRCSAPGAAHSRRSAQGTARTAHSRRSVTCVGDACSHHPGTSPWSQCGYYDHRRCSYCSHHCVSRTVTLSPARAPVFLSPQQLFLWLPFPPSPASLFPTAPLRDQHRLHCSGHDVLLLRVFGSLLSGFPLPVSLLQSLLPSPRGQGRPSSSQPLPGGTAASCSRWLSSGLLGGTRLTARTQKQGLPAEAPFSLAGGAAWSLFPRRFSKVTAGARGASGPLRPALSKQPRKLVSLPRLLSGGSLQQLFPPRPYLVGAGRETKQSCPPALEAKQGMSVASRKAPELPESVLMKLRLALRASLGEGEDT